MMVLPWAPIVRTTYIGSFLQKGAIALQRIQDSVDTILTSWSRGDRFSKLALTHLTRAALIDLTNFSRAVYWISADLTYAEQARLYGYGNFETTLPHYRIIERCNRLIEGRILVCEPVLSSVGELEAADDEELFLQGGFHTIGRRAGQEVFKFFDGAITEELLTRIHDACFQARAAFLQRTSFIADVSDLSIPVSQYMSVSQRLWEHLHKANPLPPGVEPSGTPRLTL
jgi:hypothetical protein